MYVVRCTLNVLNKTTKLINLPKLSTYNVQLATFNWAAGVPSKSRCPPAPVRVPPRGAFETSIHRAVIPLNVARCTLHVKRSQQDDQADQPIRTFNVQRSTHNVQLGRGFAKRVALSPAPFRVPPRGRFEWSACHLGRWPRLVWGRAFGPRVTGPPTPTVSNRLRAFMPETIS